MRLSILGLLIFVVIAAVILALLARLGGEAFYYITGPIVGASLAAFA